MVVISGLLFILAIWFGNGFAAYFLRAWILKPIQIPDDFKTMHRRERFLTVALILCILVYMIGVFLLVLIYIIGFVRHLRMVSKADQHGDAELTAIIPRFSLSDMLAMVFSLGFSPTLIVSLSASGQSESAVMVFILALFIFPACFLSMIYRLEANRVPAGWVRMGCLAISPYLLLGCLMTLPSALMFLWTLPSSSNTSDALPMMLFLLFFLTVLAAGRRLAVRARQAVDAGIATATAAEPMNQ